ncbi:tyrosine-type recombinase/integrase [Halobellus sp. EA9]|uniref:tyrosine-type recombinase/integrase n=1 Tax=Halobellus sp. EA9 TaxID=3421647 RepID=UPI003EBC9ABA
MSSAAEPGDDIPEELLDAVESVLGDKVEDVLEELADDSPDLEPYTPESAIDEFLESKRGDTVKSTRESYRTSLAHFVEFCEQNDINEMSELTGSDLTRYRTYRREESCEEPLAPKTMKDEQWLMNAFISHLEAIDAVKPELSDAVKIPDIDEEEEVRDEHLPRERQEQIIDYLEQYRYATAEHVTWLLLSVRGVRRCTVIALDVEDFDPEERKLELHHRPDQDTRLKNARKSERHLSLPEHVAEVIEDFIENNRHDVTDDYGRRPLLTSRYGRLSPSTIAKYVYKWSRPCVIQEGCPHGENPEDCEAMENADAASKCPSSKSPHTVRKGYITHHCKEGFPLEFLAEQADVSEDILRKHYDQSGKDDKRDLHERIFDEFYGDDEDGFYA